MGTFIRPASTGICAGFNRYYLFDGTGPQIFNIYVNGETGSDTRNSGSSATSPYQTILRAMREVASDSNADQFIINLAGADPHVVPDGFIINRNASRAGLFDAAPGNFYSLDAPLIFRATAETLQTITSGQITSQSANATTSLITINVNVTYVANAYQRKWFRDANGLIGTIESNGTGTVVVAASSALTAPIVIFDTGAVITNSAPTLANPVMTIIGSAVAFQGVQFDADDNTCLALVGGAQVGVCGSELAGVAMSLDAQGRTGPSYLVGQGALLGAGDYSLSSGAFLSLANSEIFGASCTASGVGSEFLFSTGHIVSSNTLFSGVTKQEITKTALSASRVHQVGGQLEMSNFTITAAGGVGVFVDDCASASIATGVIGTSTGPAIQLGAQSYAFVDTISGTGNSTFGVQLEQGAQADLKSNTVTGTSGDLKVGTLAVQTWADFATATARVDLTATTGDLSRAKSI